MTGAWSVTGSMSQWRSLHTATLLLNGKVLVAGGSYGLPLSSAEVYDPATGAWSPTGSMSEQRYWHTATLLPNGKVLVAGGENALSSAEVYDPVTGAWSDTGSMNQGRYWDTATLLPNDKVLVAGGHKYHTHSSAEVYDPVTGAWSATGSMNQARSYHTATLLPNAKVLVAGGYYFDTDWHSLSSAEIYTPPADFTILSIVLSPASPTPNSTFSATVMVKNQGFKSRDGGKLTVWVNQPAPQSCGATGNQFVSVGVLAAGASKKLTFSNLAAGALGNKTFRAFVDSACVTSEAYESNNQSTKTYNVGWPDLTVTGISFDPASPAANGTFSAIVTVKNNGTAASNSNQLTVWTNQPAPQSCNAGGDKTATIPFLKIGASTTMTVTGLVAGSAGNPTFRVFVDSACAIAESNENNNQRTQGYTVIDQPDLVVTGVTLNPALPITNGTFKAVVTVKNQGTAAGDGGQLSVWVNQPAVQSCNASGNKSVAVGTLAAGASKNLTVTGLPAESTAGSKTLRAFVDSACALAESREDNNQFTKTYTVIANDLAVTGVVLTPAEPMVNGTFRATVTVKNQGTVAVDGRQLTVWVNQPAIQPCNAIGDQSIAVGAIAVGESKVLTVDGLPAGAIGVKKLRAFVDSTCTLPESDEGNNQLTKGYTVYANLPDFVLTGLSLTPSSPVANSTFNATVTVKNRGTLAGDGGTLAVWANQPTTQPCNTTGDKSVAVGTLAAGASKTLTVTGLPAGSTVGSKTLRAFVDSACVTPETHETNNQGIRTYTVN